MSAKAVRALRFAVAIAAFAAAAAAQENNPLFDFEEPFSLAVLRHARIFVSEPSELAVPCDTSRPILACTRFVARRLDARCIAGEGLWRIQARAQYMPNPVLIRMETMVHEWRHIEDMRKAVVDNGSLLTSTRYSSRDDCEREARAASAGFRALMDGFARASNCARHRELCAPPPAPAVPSIASAMSAAPPAPAVPSMASAMSAPP